MQFPIRRLPRSHTLLLVSRDDRRPSLLGVFAAPGRHPPSGGTVSVIERRDLTEPERFYVVSYRDRAGEWQSGKVEKIDEANAAGVVLAEFLGCNFADSRE
jgi:hypothetical protein